MSEFFRSFDNREIAVCIWAFMLIAWAANKPDVRSSMASLVSAAFAKQIVVSVVIFAIYFVGFVWILSVAGMWAESQLKLTVFWFFSAGLAGLASAAKMSDGAANVKEKMKGNFSISVFLDFFVNLYRMPLLAELLFVPFTAVLGAVVAYSGFHEKYKKVETLGNRLIVGIGLVVLVYAVYATTTNYDEMATLDNARSLILPIAFSLGILPIFLAGVVYVSYENVFVRIPFLIKDESLHRYAKLSLVRAFRADTQRLHTWFRQAWHVNLDSAEAVDASIAKVRAE
jgi:hypothetical protein